MPASSESVVDLLRAARAGDRRALDRLLASCRTYLSILARPSLEGTLGAKADASDVVQETLLKAYEHFDEFRGTSEGEWIAWLKRILSRNLAMVFRHYRGAARRDVAREHAIERAVDRSSAALHALWPKDGETPSRVAQGREEGVLLAEALEELTADQREAIVLRSVHQLTWEEAAQRMDRSPTAVRMLWTRALRALARRLKGKDV